MNVLTIFTTSYREAAYTAVLAVVLLGLSTSAARVLSRKQSRETQRFWALAMRHVAALGFVLGLAIIWRQELQAIVVALGAATAGFLIAFRENWLSLLAFWTRVIKKPYALHSTIEIDGVRGKVIDITWLTTIIAETVPGKSGTLFSGRVIHVPNNRMYLATFAVDNLTDEYTLHVMTLPLPKGARPLVAEKLLLEVARPHCEPYFNEAMKHMARLEEEKALEIKSVEPRSVLSVGDDGAVTICMRIAVPEAESGRISQAILRDFFAKVDDAGWPTAAKSSK